MRGNSPPQPRRGGRAIKKKIRRLLIRAAGVVLFKFQNEIFLILTSTTPSAPEIGWPAADSLLMAQPPLLG